MLANENVDLLGDGYHPDLTRLPGFSLDDLRHNYDGRLSPRQSRDLKRSVLFGVLVLGVGVGWCALVAQSGPNIGVLITVLCVVVSAFRVVREALALRRASVAQVEGDAWTEMVPEPEGPDKYYIHVAHLKLDIPKVVHGSAPPGGPYRVFYLPTIKRAVAIQALPDWRSIPRPAKQSRFRLPISIEF